MRISDLSSDVFSSDLIAFARQARELCKSNRLKAEGDDQRGGAEGWVGGEFLGAGGHCPAPRSDRKGGAAAAGRGGVGVPDLEGRAAEILDEIDLRAVQQFQRGRSEEHTSDLQSLMRISYAV